MPDASKSSRPQSTGQAAREPRTSGRAPWVVGGMAGTAMVLAIPVVQLNDPWPTLVFAIRSYPATLTAAVLLSAQAHILRGLVRRMATGPRPAVAALPAARADAATLALIALAIAYDVTAISFIAHRVADISLFAVAPWLAMVTLAACASRCPLGLGITDLGAWCGLHLLLGVDAATSTSVVLLYRACTFGPILARWYAGRFDRSVRAEATRPTGVSAPRLIYRPAPYERLSRTPLPPTCYGRAA